MDKFSWWVDINERRKEIETQSIQIESLQFDHLCQLDSLTQRLQETTDAIARCIEKIPRGVRIVDNESDALVEGITAENVLREWEERQKAEAEEEAEEASRQENQEPIEGKSNDDKGDFDKSTAIPKEIDINSSANYKSTKATSRVAIHTNPSISQPAYAEKIEKIPCPIPAEVTQQSTSIPKKDSGIILADDAGRISPTDSTLNVPDNNAAADGVKRKDLLTTKPPIVSKAKQVDSKRTAVSAEVKPVESAKPEIARTLDIKESAKPISATSTNSVRDISKVTSNNAPAKLASFKLDFDTPALSLDDGDLQSSLLSILDTF
ncbi:hypothetical protein BKA69DRAFT_866187 [Paraphysoderma sedebokerense]|nr:hypothetical protein BKA69DRAFT_865987 [Paraphysoderma sedebokerense]KAI9137816.1 hypothetical protein BKA69DRAFT_866187 [Paraphysoderma sedebokerense]